MRGRAVWFLLLIAVAAAGYLAGARSGEGPGTRAERQRPTARDLVQPDPAQPDPAQAPREAPAHAPEARPPAPGKEERDAEPNPPAPTQAVSPEPSATWDRPLTGTSETGPAEVVNPGSPAETLLRDDLERGGPMGLLRGISRQRPKGPWGIAHLDGALALVHDAKTFAKVFAPRATGPVLDGTTADWGALADGTTLEYPAGVFDIRWHAAPARFPRDLVVKGAGMDRTLVRIGSPSARGDEIHGLTLVDVTVDGRRNDLLHLKDGTAALRLVRCRLVRIREVLDAEAGALHAEGCEFEGGTLLHTTWGLARLDGCTVRGTFDAYDTGDVACLFRRCAFVEAHPNLQANLETRKGVKLEECRFEVVASVPPPRLPSAINPAWPD